MDALFDEGPDDLAEGGVNFVIARARIELAHGSKESFAFEINVERRLIVAEESAAAEGSSIPGNTMSGVVLPRALFVKNG